MALLFQAGKSVPKDPEMAEMWYVRAAVQGDVRAQYKSGADVLRRTRSSAELWGGAEVVHEGRRIWTCPRAAQSGFDVFIRDRAYSADENTANKWWKRASRQGYIS